MPVHEAQEHRVIAEGYSLLYGIASQQRNVDKILIVKSASQSVHSLITEIANYTTSLSKQLEDFAAKYPALRVDVQFLPEVEVKARAAIASECIKELLLTSGKNFERLLLHSQLDALQQESHIAAVMVDLEVDARRAFWVDTHKRLDVLHDKVARLLEDQCRGG